MLTAALYAPVFGYGFIYEDRNDVARSLAAPNWSQALTDAMERPARSLTGLSFAVNQTLFGAMNPLGFHLGSLVLHLVNGLLVYALALPVMGAWAAVFALGVFLLHPMQVEAVAYVSARADLVSTTGVLLALLAASRGWRVAAVLACALAVAGKESAVVAWALVPLWAAWTRAPFPLKRWCAVGGVLGGIAYAAILRDITEFSIQPSMALAGEQLAVIFRLLALVAVPWGFTIDHDWASIAWFSPGALVGALGLTFWAVTEGWAHRHWLALAWLWTLIALSPRLVVPLYEGLHEHHVYPVLFGWCLCAGHWLTVNTRERMHYATP